MLINFKKFISNILFKCGFLRSVFYINGPETLPSPLSAEEELSLLKENNDQSRDLLIIHNLRLVVYIARKFDGSGTNIEDLISIGTIGLIKAVNTFCLERNIKLATYASRCIENEILMYLRKISSRKNEISIDEPLNVDWDGNEVGRGIEIEDEKELLNNFVVSLPVRERQIMEMRFGMNGYKEYTQKEVADTLGISQSYISRLEKRIIVKLKKQIEKAV